MAEFKETAESKELDKEGLSENESSGPSSEVQEQKNSELEQEDNDSLEGSETESESENTSEGDESDTPEQTGETEREQPLMTETEEGNNDIGEEDTLDDSGEQNEPLDIDEDSNSELSESSTELPEEDDSKNEPLDTEETSETDKAEPSDDTQEESDANEEKIDPCEQKSESKNDNVDDGSGEDDISDSEEDVYDPREANEQMEQGERINDEETKPTEDIEDKDKSNDEPIEDSKDKSDTTNKNELLPEKPEETKGQLDYDEAYLDELKKYRSIPGTPGIVNVKVNSEGKTVGNSSELSKNLWDSFEDVPLASYDSTDDLPQKAKGYQAQHIIPVEMHDHPVLQKIGMDMNDASNGMFLPEPNGEVHALTTHKGYHAVYNKVCKEYLDKIYEKHGDDAPVEVVEADVAKLQRGLKSVLEDGLPIYRRKSNADQLDVSERGGGATEDLLRKAIDKEFEI